VDSRIWVEAALLLGLEHGASPVTRRCAKGLFAFEGSAFRSPSAASGSCASVAASVSSRPGRARPGRGAGQGQGRARGRQLSRPRARRVWFPHDAPMMRTRHCRYNGSAASGSCASVRVSVSVSILPSTLEASVAASVSSRLQGFLSQETRRGSSSAHSTQP
jgi:hypothetical protein